MSVMRKVQKTDNTQKKGYQCANKDCLSNIMGVCDGNHDRRRNCKKTKKSTRISRFTKPKGTK